MMKKFLINDLSINTHREQVQSKAFGPGDDLLVSLSIKLHWCLSLNGTGAGEMGRVLFLDCRLLWCYLRGVIKTLWGVIKSLSGRRLLN